MRVLAHAPDVRRSQDSAARRRAADHPRPERDRRRVDRVDEGEERLPDSDHAVLVPRSEVLRRPVLPRARVGRGPRPPRRPREPRAGRRAARGPPRRRRRSIVQAAEERQRQRFTQLVNAGIQIILGADVGWGPTATHVGSFFGYAEHLELAAFVRLGHDARLRRSSPAPACRRRRSASPTSARSSRESRPTSSSSTPIQSTTSGTCAGSRESTCAAPNLTGRRSGRPGRSS